MPRLTDQQLPLVSIITPAFNAARFIQETIQSVQTQTYQHWEMIIVDDCSRDHTCEIIQHRVAADRRVRLIKHTHNGGPSAARNTALKAARGRYIAFLDSDDLWLPSKLERQLAFMQESKAALSFTQYRRISETGEACGRLMSIPQTLTYHDLLKNTAMATLTVIIDREMTGSFAMVNTHYDDFTLWLLLLKRGFTAYGLREDLARYRIVGTSWSRHKGKSAMWVWHTYRQIEGLSIPRAAWCFLHYAWNGYVKYRRF